MEANPNTLSPRLSARRFQAGFSLVEVVLAVGIMALGVVTILGLLPHGLEMSRRTANEQAQTRIVDQIVGEMQSAEWASFNGLATDGKIIYQFDDQGIATSDADLTTYVAQATLGEPGEATDGTQVLSNKSGLRNPNLRRVNIAVAATQDPSFNFINPPPAAAVKRFSALIAKMRP